MWQWDLVCILDHISVVGLDSLMYSIPLQSINKGQLDISVKLRVGCSYNFGFSLFILLQSKKKQDFKTPTLGTVNTFLYFHLFGECHHNHHLSVFFCPGFPHRHILCQTCSSLHQLSSTSPARITQATQSSCRSVECDIMVTRRQETTQSAPTLTEIECPHQPCCGCNIRKNVLNLILNVHSPYQD